MATYCAKLTIKLPARPETKTKIDMNKSRARQRSALHRKMVVVVYLCFVALWSGPNAILTFPEC